MQIENAIHQARVSIKMLLHELPSSELLQNAMERVENGVEVLILLAGEVEKSLSEDPFLVNKLILLNRKGGGIYFNTSDQVWQDSFCIVDYDKVYVNNILFSSEEGVSKIRPYLEQFTLMMEGQTPYLQSEDDLDVKLEVSKDILLKGDEVKLSWEVKNADKVVVSPVGEVKPFGLKRIRPDKTVIFRLGAYNADQASFRTVCVKVYDNVNIDYDLSFQNLRTKQYTSLVNEENYPHVYGVAEGNSVRLTWQVEDAKTVQIEPFGISLLSGSHEFHPEKNLEIDIKVSIFNQEFVRKIYILVFPIPILKEKLLQEVKEVSIFGVPDIENLDKADLLEKIKNGQASHNEFLKNLLRQEEKRYEELRDRIQQLIFDNSGKKYNLYHVNRGVFAKLQRFYDKKTHINEVIQSIKAYYDEPRE